MLKKLYNKLAPVSTVIVGNVGQIHHVISTKIARALDGHAILAGTFIKRDNRLVTQAIDLTAHRGYQRWHRDLDDEVGEYIRNHPNITLSTFVDYLKGVYDRPDIKARFPDGF
ncbi:MAG: hypothetical protein ABI557_04670 [Aureliella sp.]